MNCLQSGFVSFINNPESMYYIILCNIILKVVIIVCGFILFDIVSVFDMIFCLTAYTFAVYGTYRNIQCICIKFVYYVMWKILLFFSTNLSDETDIHVPFFVVQAQNVVFAPTNSAWCIKEMLSLLIDVNFNIDSATTSAVGGILDICGTVYFILSKLIYYYSCAEY